MKKEESIANIKTSKKISRFQNKKDRSKFLNFILWFLEIGLFIWDIGKTLIIIIAIAFIIRFYIVQPFYVEGQSMEPNFNNGEYLLIDEITYHFRNPERGEVIVFRPPVNTYQNYIKRIIALPNEEISFGDSGVLIKNGGEFILNESYLAPGTITQGSGTIRLEENQFFVMGDNRSASSDSRSFGPLNRKNITGKVWFFIKTKPWKNLTLFGKNITIPKISSMGKLQKPEYSQN